METFIAFMLGAQSRGMSSEDQRPFVHDVVRTFKHLSSKTSDYR